MIKLVIELERRKITEIMYYIHNLRHQNPVTIPPWQQQPAGSYYY